MSFVRDANGGTDLIAPADPSVLTSEERLLTSKERPLSVRFGVYTQAEKFIPVESY